MNAEMPGIIDLARMFNALGHPQRLALFERLRAAASTRCRSGKEGEMCVCDLAEGVDTSLSTVSHHLRKLRDAGLIRCDKRAQWVFCSVNADALEQIGRFAEQGLRGVHVTATAGQG